MADDDREFNFPLHRYRLAWKYRSGTTGRGPWMQDLDVVEAWKESLSRRYREIEHWVETENGERIAVARRIEQ
jgi:hypothetical protein